MTYGVDLSLSVLVTRDYMGDADLDINDASKFRVAGPAVFGGTSGWERKQVSSPIVDGEFTTHRRRTNVTESLAVYVAGSDTADMFTNIRELVSALTQDRYTLQFNIGSAVIQWDCESAEYSVEVDTPHMVARYAKVTFSIPRKPLPLAGGY
jgi:hypothetical protein